MLHCNKLQLATCWAIAAAALTGGSAVAWEGELRMGIYHGKALPGAGGVGWQTNKGQEPSASPINTMLMNLVE